MECSCAINIDHDGGPSVCTEKIVTARKTHTCDECLRKIKPGEKYENVKTLEGFHIACPGDWIIRGIKGEYYPCKPDIFEQTYDQVQ